MRAFDRSEAGIPIDEAIKGKSHKLDYLLTTILGATVILLLCIAFYFNKTRKNDKALFISGEEAQRKEEIRSIGATSKINSQILGFLLQDLGYTLERVDEKIVVKKPNKEGDIKLP